MKNILSFLPDTYSEHKILKTIEKIVFFITLVLGGIWAFVSSSYKSDAMCYCLLILCVLEIVLSGKLYLDKRELFLVLAMLLYKLIVKEQAIFTFVMTSFSAYLLGKMIVLNGGKKYRKRIVQLFSVIAIGMAIGSILDFTNFAPIENHRVLDWLLFWEDNTRYCTHYAFFIIPISCLLFWAICSLSEHILLSMVIIGLTFVCNLNIMKSFTRMGALITVLVAAVMAGVFFVKNCKKVSVRRIYGIALIVLMILGTLVVVRLLTDDQLNKVVNDTMNRDNGIVGNIRIEIAKDVLSQLPSHPWGGIDTSTGYMAHNVWLEIARRSGILPMLLAIIYSAICVRDAVVCIVKAKDKTRYEYYIVGLFMGLYLYYMVEPAIVTSVYIWALGCMTSGVIRACNIQRLNQKKEAKKKKKKKSNARRVKKAPVMMAILLLMVSLTGCVNKSDVVLSGDLQGEYIDDAEYDDIALMGAGTKDDPYLINSYEDMIYFYNSVNYGWQYNDKYILQTNDIDMDGIPFWPIAEASGDYAFMGTYDGGGHVIKNVHVYTEYYSAIFGKLSGTIMNLGVVDCYIEGWKAAGLVGMCSSSDARILNCYTASHLDGKEMAGITASGDGMILGCFSQCIIDHYDTADDWHRVALQNSGKMDECYTSYIGYDKAECMVNNEETYWLEDELSMEEVADRLNDSIFEISRYTGIEQDEFCTWRVSSDGNSVRLTTTKQESDFIPKKYEFRERVRNEYPYLPALAGLVIAIFVVASTMRVGRKKRK